MIAPGEPKDVSELPLVPSLPTDWLYWDTILDCEMTFWPEWMRIWRDENHVVREYQWYDEAWEVWIAKRAGSPHYWWWDGFDEEATFWVDWPDVDVHPLRLS